jgi:Protein of unknown function (DUF2802)
MIMNLDTTISVAGAVLGALGLICALVAFRAVRRGRARCATMESSLAALRSELDLVGSTGIKTGQRVKRIAEAYSGLNARVDQLELRGSAQSFDQAIDAARRGADTSKLTQQFGLNRSEADLVARLHGRARTA